MKSVYTINPALQNFDDLPDYAFVRIPVVQGIYSCSPTTIWRAVKQGRIPAPHKISANTTGWNVGELRKAIDEVKAKGDR